MDKEKLSEIEAMTEGKSSGVEIEGVTSTGDAQFNPKDFDVHSGKPFPEDPVLKARETRQLTLRSILVGSVCGIVIGAANIYIGLKTGWGLGAGVFAVFVGFAVLKTMERYFVMGWGGGYFGPKENVSCQSAANGAASGSGPFVAAVPAMYALGLLTTPQQDFGRLVTLGIVCAFYGTFFAIPLRKFYILQQSLKFPDAIATSIAIRTLHSSAANARRQIRWLFGSFTAAFAWNVVRDYAPGIMREWHWFWWISRFAGDSILAAENWYWGVVITSPVFFGLGIFVGLAGAIWFYVGCILAWGIIGPATVAAGLAAGVVVGDEMPGRVLYFSSKAGTPRYWLLWPGLFVMICASLTEVAMGYKAIWIGVKTIWDKARRRQRVYEGEIEDPAAPSEQVPLWAWLSGLVASIVFSIVILKFQFGVQVGHTILAIVLAFLFSLIGVQSVGTIGINPVGPIAKCSQLVFGGISKAQGQPIQDAQMTNIIAGSVAGQAASHSVDMVVDLKIGHLLSATPKGQFWAQLVGTVFTVVPMAGAFVVFAKAYPCIIDHTIEKCPFQMPAVMAWKAVAVAMTSPVSPIPKSSGICAIVLGICAIISVVLKHRYHKYQTWFPNWVAIGIAFLLPTGQGYAFAMLCGAITAYFMNKYKPHIWDYIGYPLAAGFAAGEAVSGLLNAGLVVAGVAGDEVGTQIGCPWNGC